jgi:putative YhbY family RNA-binding protein
MTVLSAAERRALKARAHPLRPVVIVGSKGLSESVVKEADIALQSHELIKVKLASDDREERASQYLALAAALDASPVQQIGKVAVLYREKAEAPAPPAEPVRARRPAPRRPRTVSRPPSAATTRERSHSRTLPSRARRTAPKARPARKPRPRP